TNPGFVVRITQSGLDYAQQQGIAILEKELANVKLPDISSGSRLRFTGLDLRDFRFPYSRISPVPNVGLRVSIANAYAKVNGNYRVKFGFIRSSGSFDLTVDNANIDISLRLGNDTSGKPTVTTSGCSSHISKVRVRFSGSLGWLYNLFHKLIESKIRKILNDKVCGIVTKSVDKNLQPYVQTLPVTARIDAVAGVDYSLVEPPTATAQSLDVAMKGEFFYMANRSAAPFTPLQLTLPPDHDRMVYFGASSYFFNTASFAYHEAGALVFEITDSMISKGNNFRLDTTTFSAFVPQLEELYPDMKMKFRLFAPSPPLLSIGPGGLSLFPVVDIQAYAILPNSSLAPLFLISVSGNGSAVINVKSCHLVGSLKMSRMTLSLKHSDVGTFEVESLQSVINFLASSILLPRINARLGQGFPLPMPKGLKLSNIVVQFHPNFVLVGGDIRSQP
ncbi:BPI protein, partial [Thinocorus orbignyianus]|nr:BPI protein [Thinocorus orbignyianus]